MIKVEQYGPTQKVEEVIARKPRADVSTINPGPTAVESALGVAQQITQDAVEAKILRDNSDTDKKATEAMRLLQEKAFEFEHHDKDFATQGQRYSDYYRELTESYRGEISDPRLFERFQSGVDDFAHRQGLSVRSKATTADIEQQKSTMQSSLSDLSQVAIQGDDDFFSETVSRGVKLIDESLIHTTDEKDQLKQSFRNELSRGKVQQDINSNPVLALERIQSNQYPELNAEEQSMYEARAMSKISQNKTRADAESLAAAKEFVSDVTLSLKNGIPLREGQLDQAREMAAELSPQIQEDLSVAYAASKYVTFSKAERDAVIPTVVGAENAELRVELEAANSMVERELDRDAYSFAVGQGVINDVAVDLSDPSTLNARLKELKIAQDHYDREFDVLTESEVLQFTNDVNNDPASETVNKLKSVSQLPHRDALRVFSQIGEKGGHMFAQAGGIALSGAPLVSEQVLKGQEMLRDGTAKNPSMNDYLDVFNDYVGEVYEGVNRSSTLEATIAHYAAKNKTIFDRGDFLDSLKDVTGGVAEVNGNKVQLPRNTHRRDFDRYLDRFTPEAVEFFGGVEGISNENVADMIQRGVPISVGDNQYEILFNGSKIWKNENERFVISFYQDLYEMSLPGVKNRNFNEIVDDARSLSSEVPISGIQ